jgi:hypothetical protein
LVLPQTLKYPVLLSVPAGVLGLARLGLGIVVGVALWMAKPVAMVLLRIYLVLSSLLSALSVFGLVRAAAHFNTPWLLYSWPVLRGTGASIVLLLAAAAYFSLSERVRATYGSKLFS